jgi:hypothetical protein
MNVEDILDVGDDRVMVPLTQRVDSEELSPRGTCITAWVFTLTGRLVSRTEAYASCDEALEAAGLAE